MKRLIKFLIILSIFFNTAFAVNSKYYQDKFNTTKKLYLGAVMSNNKKKEVEYLRKLIRYGDKLKKNTIKYKRELNRLDKSVVVTKPIKTTFKLKPKYSIRSVKQDKNTIIITFNKKINKSYLKFSEKKVGNYYYDTFDIKGNFKNAKPTKLYMRSINKITIYQYKKNTLRISFKNRVNPSTIYIFNDNKLIIKLLENKNVSKWKQKKIKKRAKKAKEVKIIPSNNNYYHTNKVIVIDPGHGGKDAGAVGSSRNYEKTVVLNISKYLKKELTKKGFTVYLTRAKDKFVKLPNRTKYANRKKADMFVSIHANAARKSRAKVAHGVETYFLSPARSKRAKRVAALENKGDIKRMGWSSKNSLLTILNQSKITASNKMAIDIQKNMLYYLRQRYGNKSIKDGGVREGPFWVLVGAQMPSVLVEVGYISHPTEGKRIATYGYQKQIAKGIAEGILSYFIKN